MKAGADVSPLWDPENDWESLRGAFEPWTQQVASHLASACISAAAITDVPQILIDGALPPHVRALIVARTEEAVGKLPTTGLSAFRILPGTLGYSARVIGAASLPMQERFAHDLAALLKADPLAR